jgi:hypothetical protein
VADPNQPFTVRLGVTGGRSRSELSLGVTIYRALPNPTAFDDTLDGSPVGAVLEQSDAIALSTLTPDTADDQGGDLSIPVTAGDVTSAGNGPFTADLHCDTGSCGGVYPVRLTLTGSGSRVESRLLTYLVYTNLTNEEPLRFALVLPLALSKDATTDGQSADSAVGGLTKMMAALSGERSAVPVTIEPDPTTVAVLEGSATTSARQALSSLSSLITGTGRETLCGPYAPVNANALVSAGLKSELSAQVHRGGQVLDGLTHSQSCTGDSSWVSNTALDAPTLGALASLGATHVVVPPSAVAGPSPTTTPTRLFTWAGTTGTGSAMLSDPELSSRLTTTARRDPALAADQILAGLELDYYEAPNTPDARGVVAVPADKGDVNPTVVSDLLDGLGHNPMVEPVTLGALFSAVPVGGSVGRVSQPATHRPASVDNAGDLPARAIRDARARLTGFSAAVAGSSAGRTVASALGDELLGAESQNHDPTQQREAVGRFESDIDHQLSSLSITSREVRLTARTGSVPITVIKTSPYPVEAVLTASSDKITFSADSAQAPNTECQPPVITNSAGKSSVSSRCTFVHGTNAVYVEMRSRVSGDFRLTVTLDSPANGLELASGQLTVRSMSTSAVAIGLSAAAAVVLFGWWGRTIWRSRRVRRGLHRRRRVSPA